MIWLKSLIFSPLIYSEDDEISLHLQVFKKLFVAIQDIPMMTLEQKSHENKLGGGIS